MPWQWWYSCILILILSGTAALSNELLIAASLLWNGNARRQTSPPARCQCLPGC
jgi:hypothetical protein